MFSLVPRLGECLDPSTKRGRIGWMKIDPCINVHLVYAFVYVRMYVLLWRADVFYIVLFIDAYKIEFAQSLAC